MVPTVAISVPTNLLAAILPANCALVIPAVLDKLLVVKPVAEIVPPLIEIPEPAPAVKAVCFALNIFISIITDAFSELRVEEKVKPNEFDLMNHLYSILNKWFIENKDYPYPDEATTDYLAKDAGLLDF